MEEKHFTYRKLRVYHEAKKYVLLIYQLIKAFPQEETFALSDQLRRASVSIVSNIVEGASRSSQKEQAHFIEIAYGSLSETMCQIEIAYELSYIDSRQLKEVEELYNTIAQMLSGLKRRTRSEER